MNGMQPVRRAVTPSPALEVYSLCPRERVAISEVSRRCRCQQVQDSDERYTNVTPTGAGQRQALHLRHANRCGRALSVTPMSRQQAQDSDERYPNITPTGAGQCQALHLRHADRCRTAPSVTLMPRQQ
eukprot:1176849-Prorocentrum_minimum.AAC.1